MRKLLLIVIIPLLLPTIAIANQIESKGGAVAILTDSGISWTNPNGASQPENSELFARAENIPREITAKKLIVGEWNLKVPSNAIVTGILIKANVRDYPGYCNVAMEMSLIKAGVFSKSNLKIDIPYQWPFYWTEFTGGEKELWGWNLTPEELNSTTFGVSFRIEPTNCGQQIIDVNNVGVIVYYTESVKTSRVNKK
jgi:hypothetical protein